ncbi:MAG: DUF4476 domain-containing protein [Bacteroidaceae bacterium]|nr:DUF4476 domain-containing protein [Bacteroidaceae bacterium]
MKKTSVITMLVVFALGMPLMASGQSQRMERRPKKEMRDEFRPKAMQDKDFKMMCEVVDDASFTEKKIGVIKVACISSYFTSEQCAKLLSMISFDTAKLEALRVLSPRVLNIDARVIQEQFSFSSSKKEAMKIMFPDR